MSGGKILVCDDEKSLCEQCLKSLQEIRGIEDRFSIDLIEQHEFVREMNELKNRQIELRKDNKLEYDTRKECYIKKN